MVYFPSRDGAAERAGPAVRRTEQIEREDRDTPELRVTPAQSPDRALPLSSLVRPQECYRRSEDVPIAAAGRVQNNSQTIEERLTHADSPRAARFSADVK